MTVPNRAVAAWFGSQKNDAQCLSQWRSAPLTFSADQAIDEAWHVDRYEVILGKDSSGELFQRAARLTLRNRFYPPQVMVNTSDFQLEDRPLRTGDRIMQRIRILFAWGKPLLEILTMNEITEVIDEPRCKGFTYTTTAVHSEVGEWSPSVVWRENDEVALIINVVSRTRPGASRTAQRIARWLQMRAHRLSIQNFRSQLQGGYAARAAQVDAFVPANVLPVGLLALAGVLFLGMVFNLNHRK